MVAATVSNQKYPPPLYWVPTGYLPNPHGTLSYRLYVSEHLVIDPYVSLQSLGYEEGVPPPAQSADLTSQLSYGIIRLIIIDIHVPFRTHSYLWTLSSHLQEIQL